MEGIPSWGRVVARPHEFLIQMRQGRIVKSGQGMSCFEGPGDSVAVLATSIAKLSFVADQVTEEQVGVAVTGLAVYRIAEPLLAYRMFDLDRMSLETILRDMFIGATRRIVAGLSLEECLTHRKERVAAALMTEISPVLAGEGAAADGTSTGWGVILDTVEIQDVKVLSEQVFSQLQAPFRESLALRRSVRATRS
jgi:flotillin